MNNHHYIDSFPLDLTKIQEIISSDKELKLSEGAIQRIENFKLATKQNLENIKKDAALLTGKPEKYLKDVKFEDFFLGNTDKGNVCGSFLSGSTIKNFGKQGLRQIEDEIFKETNNSKITYLDYFLK